MNLQTAIYKLMRNDKNATWNECITVEELKEGLMVALENYSKEEDTYIFYMDILQNVK